MHIFSWCQCMQVLLPIWTPDTCSLMKSTSLGQSCILGSPLRILGMLCAGTLSDYGNSSCPDIVIIPTNVCQSMPDKSQV